MYFAAKFSDYSSSRSEMLLADVITQLLSTASSEQQFFFRKTNHSNKE